MTTVRALLDAKPIPSSRRAAVRRKLRLPAEGASTAGGSDVLILDLSTTGFLLQTSGELSEGETIELEIPEAVGVRAVVRWSSGRLFGCQFEQPISLAAVSAALLRAPHDQRPLDESHALPDTLDSAQGADPASKSDEKLSLPARMRWIVGLTLLSWGLVAAAALVVSRYIL